MTFDALATVITAFNLLEVGQVGVCRSVLTDFSGSCVPSVKQLPRTTYNGERFSLQVTTIIYVIFVSVALWIRV